MKKLFVLLCLIAMSPLPTFATLPEGVPKIRYSPDPLFNEEGFRMGLLIRFESDIFWHYEGKLMLGLNSNPKNIMDPNCVEEETAAAQSIANLAARDQAMKMIDSDCFIDVNPWPFSTTDKFLFNKFSGHINTPVVIYYTHPAWGPWGVAETGAVNALFTNTSNYASKIWDVGGEYKAPVFYSTAKGELPFVDTLNSATGYIDGYIVKATLDHLLQKTYEITVQEGAGGGNFRRLSVDTSEMFDHVVLAMLSGKVLRIGYIKLFDAEGYWVSAIRGYTTYYRVVSIEILR